ncbi:ATP-binding cassette domain-containing protein [Thalassospira sp. MA62]|nr:ATP-binding cassette domain-containing protein [Thalassospira sp. MA62]
MLELTNISVGFGEDPVLADVNMTVLTGETLLICGAGSSGKSTLMNTASGVLPRLVHPRSFNGGVSLNGKQLSEMSGNQLFSAISIVGQNIEDQLWDLSVEDLIAFPLENRGMSKGEIRDKIAALITELQLQPLLGRSVMTLSGGERRMAGIGSALALSPELLVLDEPTTGLDPAARQRLVRAMKQASGDVSAMLIAEQDAASLVELVDRVALLADGKLAQPIAMSDIAQQAEPWLNAGVLPPFHRRPPSKAGTAGKDILEVKSIRTELKRHNGSPVLDDASFTLRAGEVISLIGRNGAGKTTLFQSILGLAKTAAGRIVIDGEDATAWTSARRARKVAYLPQNMRRILFNFTVLEEVLFAITASTAKNHDTAIVERASATLQRYGLGDLAEANPFALSARQQALLGLACAEAADAPVVILDEPLLARDRYGREMLDQFLTTAIGKGVAVMLISHDLELVDDVTSRTLILDGGRIVFDGTTEESWTSAAFGSLGWPAPTQSSQGGSQ